MKCGNCTLCCTLGYINETNSPIGEDCKYCDVGIGCQIYNNRPSECREYQCMWSQMNYAGEELRPDRSHIIFDKISDRVIQARQEEGVELGPFALGQLNSFLKQGFSIVILDGNKRKLYRANGHTNNEIKEDIVKWQRQVIQRI